MFFIAILLGLLTISFGSNVNQGDRFVDFKFLIHQASMSLHSDRRVTGGIIMQKDDLPNFNYQVGMFISKQDGSLSICGGALVHPKIVLTAGHCVYKCRLVSIFMGTHIKPPSEFSSGNIRVGAENITLHEDYNDWTLEDDIALIELPYEVKMSETIGIIQLASYTWANCESGKAWVSGWGKTSDSQNSIPDDMNYLEVEPISYEKCYAAYSFLNRGKQLCSSGDLFKGICPGDSGGPYAFEDEDGSRYLCGLNSFVANSGCINNLPKGYTSVAYYNDNGWICKNSKGLVGCFDHNYNEL